MHGESHATKVFVYQWCVNALIVNGLGNDLRNYVSANSTPSKLVPRARARLSGHY